MTFERIFTVTIMVKMFNQNCAIDDYGKDGGEEHFTKMHCVLITNP